MKSVNIDSNPTNILFNKDRSSGLYLADFDHRQTSPRLTLGSRWIGEDNRYNRKYLFRVVDMGYQTEYSSGDALRNVREAPHKQFRDTDHDYFCREIAYVKLEGEFVGNQLIGTHDQPAVLRTYLRPTNKEDDEIIASPDLENGFMVGNLRDGNHKQGPPVTLEDRFVGFRTLICGASGFGKSTFVRNIGRYWLENKSYGVLIDDLKGEYVNDIKNQRGETVLGLKHHPSAGENLYLLTPYPAKYEDDPLIKSKTIKLDFHIDDIPPDGLGELTTHLTDAQRQFLDMYFDKPDLFSLLLRKNEHGGIFTKDWHTHFREFIIAIKAQRKIVDSDNYKETNLDDFNPNSLKPIYGVRKHLVRLVNMPFITNVTGGSCLSRVRELLKSGATIIVDKSGLTDPQKAVISTVLASELYNHNEKYSSGNKKAQQKVIPFVYLVEEAHLLLSRERAREGSVFVNFAKTGRGFQIGVVAVTQRPSSVDINILSQFDNYVTFRLTNKKDVDDLVRAKSEFEGYEGEIRTMETGMAVTAFGEPTKVQSIKGFNWNEERAKSLLSKEQEKLKAN
ncbi:MAG: ATP-binding protein [Bacteroidota bacterium]